MPTDPWPDTIARARRLEGLGYHHLWVYDHMSWQRYREESWHATYPWLAGIAAGTERIRLGTMVSNPNIRHPALLAKDAMTIDHISDGRLTIGLGAGGTGFDADLLGTPPLSPKERADRLEEFARTFDGLLRGTLADHAGVYYEFHGARVLPGCIQQPRVPVAIAAERPRTLCLAAEIGDAWITQGNPADGEQTAADTERIVRDQREVLERRCDETGRDPSSIDRIFLVGSSGERVLASTAAFDDFVGRYRELGFTDVVFHHPRPDDPLLNDDPAIVDEIAAGYLG